MVYVFKKACIKDFDEVFSLYQDVIKNTFTTWGNGYPSKVLIKQDIAQKKLYVLKDNNKIIAVSYLGKNEAEDEAVEVKLTKPICVARICVSPNYQSMGIGGYFMGLLKEEAKKMGADGMHFHVCTQNPSAMKMYEKVGFKNCGLGKSNYGYDFYKYEIKF
ncbi:MAG: GNAT family N-acetyltransferase [Clostridia bacterium]|nr:GNAT family N-acetyltransferase [Clostridia bacterium]